jgi:hypothetical protein
MADTQTNLAWETLLDLSATRPGPLHHRLAEAIRVAEPVFPVRNPSEISCP